MVIIVVIGTFLLLLLVGEHFNQEQRVNHFKEGR